MAKRWRFFIAQTLWLGLAIGLVATGRSDFPLSILGTIAMMFVLTTLVAQSGSNNEQLMQRRGDGTMARAGVTAFMWLIYVGALMAGINQIGAVMIPFAVIMMIPLLALNAFMWGKSGSKSENATQSLMGGVGEKRKRERIDNVLRDLSDDDLIRLKRRLSDGTINEEHLYGNIIGDDGELVDYSG